MHGDVLILLMDVLKWLPILGTGMWFLEFIFLKRNWKQDQHILRHGLQRARAHGHPVWMLIFPEGTLNTARNRAASEAYARKMDLPERPEIVLLPRSTGLFHSISLLQPTGLFDVTVGYPGCQREVDPYDRYLFDACFFGGQYPREIHMHVRHVRVVEVPGFREKDLLIDAREAEGEVIAAPAPDASSLAYTTRLRPRSCLPSSYHSPAMGEWSPGGAGNSVDSPSSPPPDKHSRAGRISSPRVALFHDWLRGRFLEKDRLMHHFYRANTFPTSPVAGEHKEGASPGTTAAPVVRAIRPQLQDWASLLFCWLIFFLAWEYGARRLALPACSWAWAQVISR